MNIRIVITLIKKSTEFLLALNFEQDYESMVTNKRKVKYFIENVIMWSSIAVLSQYKNFVGIASLCKYSRKISDLSPNCKQL